MKKPSKPNMNPKPRVHHERIGSQEWTLEEHLLDVEDDVVLWDENPRIVPMFDPTSIRSEKQLELKLTETRGFDDLKQSIEKIGQLEPIYVWRHDEDDKFQVLEGATRVVILRDLARKHAGGPKEAKFTRVKAKVLPPEFGLTDRIILLARIHVRGSGVRTWGRYTEAKFVYDIVMAKNGKKPLMSVKELGDYMGKSASWVSRLKDAYEFANRFIEHVDASDAVSLAQEEFSTLEEISKARTIGPWLKDYENSEHDKLRTEVFDMVRNKVFSEYRDARFMKEFYDDPEKWELLKSGKKDIASQLAKEVQVNATTVKAKIAQLESAVKRAIDAGDHGLDEADVAHLRRAMMHIQEQVHQGARPFHIALADMTGALSEASLADVKTLDLDRYEEFKEAVAYFNGLVQKRLGKTA
jgi:hypothetical protein